MKITKCTLIKNHVDIKIQFIEENNGIKKCSSSIIFCKKLIDSIYLRDSAGYCYVVDNNLLNETEIFLIDTLTTTYTSASNYLLFNSKENKKQISFLNFENEKFTILADKKFNNLTFNELNETFKIIGKVVQKITSNIDPKK